MGTWKEPPTVHPLTSPTNPFNPEVLQSFQHECMHAAVCIWVTLALLFLLWHFAGTWRPRTGKPSLQGKPDRSGEFQYYCDFFNWTFFILKWIDSNAWYFHPSLEKMNPNKTWLWNAAGWQSWCENNLTQANLSAREWRSDFPIHTHKLTSRDCFLWLTSKVFHITAIIFKQAYKLSK